MSTGNYIFPSPKATAGQMPFEHSLIMMPPEENLDILQNLELAVAEVWRDYPEMTDYIAFRAYEAAHRLYKDEVRGRIPKPCALTGLDLDAFETVIAICEYRLGRKPLPGPPPHEPIEPVPVAVLVDCLGKLMRSVERHTAIGGRQGYLTFIDEFVP